MALKYDFKVVMWEGFKRFYKGVWMKILAISFLVFSSLLAQDISPLPISKSLSSVEKIDTPFEIDKLKILWAKRIEQIHASGVIPLIDIESSFNPGKFDLIEYAKMMDKYGVALIAFSPQIGDESYEKEGKVWHDAPRSLLGADPYRYVPTTTAGIYPTWTKEPLRFVQETIEKATKDNYPLLGEFEFRHYPSPRQAKRNELYRDVSIPIDSEAGHLLFAYAQSSGKSFQIHYEVEDALLAPLEKMLQTYPKAKVIWCHLAQIRYSGRAEHYTPEYIRGLIERNPNLYFDLAFGDANSMYKPSGEYHATIWSKRNVLKPEWAKLIEDYPYRFLTAFDIGGDRHDELPEKIEVSRDVLKNLSPKTQEIVAYKAFWKLVFGEDI